MRSKIPALLAFLLATAVPLYADEAPRYLIGDEAKGAVIRLLRENRAKYGDDAAIMQGLLMMHAVQTDAVLATEAGIVGFEETGGRKFVAFRVVTGVIFNDRTHDRDARLKRIWQGVLERTLAKYETFKVPGDGVAIEVEYSHRPYGSMSDLYGTIDDTGETERAKFYVFAPDVVEFANHRLSAHELAERSKIFLDQKPVALDLRETAAATPTPAG